MALQAKGDLDAAIEQYRVLVDLRQEAAAALRDYLAKEKDTLDTHQRVECARGRLKELES